MASGRARSRPYARPQGQKRHAWGDQICGDEIRRESPTQAYVSVTERGGPMSTIGFHHLLQRLGKAAPRQFYQKGVPQY